ncbi:hypothetical protein [Sinosporangium siamense]|nr:hypothetical protein [Sinosporangium siamense]
MSARLYTGILALSLAVLAGCGGQGEQNTAAPAGEGASPDSGQNKPRLVQDHVAACMKEQGFKYISYTPSDVKTEEDRKMESGDYETMKKYRSKYGYGSFAFEVYPEHRDSGARRSPNPNDKMTGSLSAAQRTAYDKAHNACSLSAAKSVLGMKVSKYDDILKEQVAVMTGMRQRILDGDPNLVQLAQKFGDCMKAKGYEITSMKPTNIVGRGASTFIQERSKVLGLDDGPPEEGEGKKLSPTQARAYLAKEIKDALDDLECGKDFYAAYTPKETEVFDQVRQDYSVESGIIW